MSGRRLLMLLFAALGVVFSACSDDDVGADVEPSACVVDADCPTGTCQFGLCVEPGTTALSVALVMEPPAFRSDLSALHVTRLPVTFGDPLPDFALRPPIAVRGVVLFNGTSDGVGAPADAELRFRSTGGVPGFEYEALTRSDPGTGEYEIALPPGAYDVWLTPDRVDVSQTRAYGIEVNGTSEFRPFSLTAPAQYFVISGVVEREVGGVLEPISGAKVFAATEDGRHESTLDVTGDDGAFIVLVPPSESPYLFQVRPTEDAQWVPTATFEGMALTEDWEGRTLHLSIGEFLDPVPLNLSVETPDGAPVSNATVNVRAQLGTWEGREGAPGVASGRYDLRVSSEEIVEGLATVSVPPGRVEIYAAPLEADLGLGVPTVVNARPGQLSGEPIRVVVEQRHRVRGRVVGAGEGIGDVQIDARLRTTDLLPLSRYALPSSAFGASTTTSDDGTFAFQAQPGVWDVDIVPTAESGFGRMRAELEVGRGPVADWTLTLPASGVVQGRLLDDENAPLAGATVRAFILRDGVASPLGDAVSDASGVYRIVLPTQSPDEAATEAADEAGSTVQ